MIDNKNTTPACPASTTILRQQLHVQVNEIADFRESFEGRFLAFQSKLQVLVWALARFFIALFLRSRHERLQSQNRDYPGYRRFPQWLSRTLRTMFGEVRYQRAYWHKRHSSGGFHPLDAELGLTRDGFSPRVISLACRLATYLSYAKTSWC